MVSSCFLAVSPPFLLSSSSSAHLSSHHHSIFTSCPMLQPRLPSIRVRQLQCIRSMSKDVNVERLDVPRSVPVQVAHELLQAGHRYLDVRTPQEYSAGHAVGAVNVPYMFTTAAGMTKNPNFLEEVSSIFGNDTEIIVGCQIGKRSLMAATDLSSAGFTGITDIAGGYSAWMENGLPTVM